MYQVGDLTNECRVFVDTCRIKWFATIYIRVVRFDLPFTNYKLLTQQGTRRV